MRKLVSIGMLAMGLATASFAQQSPKKKGGHDPKTPEEKATRQTEKLKKELALNEEQAPKVKALLLQQQQEIETIRTKYANATDKKSERNELITSREKNETALKEILTADQWTKYETAKEERKDHKGKGHHKHD